MGLGIWKPFLFENYVIFLIGFQIKDHRGGGLVHYNSRGEIHDSRVGTQNFCYPGIIENFALACGASHSIFTPAARCAAVLFVTFCQLFSSDTPQFIPLRWLEALRYPIFPQAQRDGVFFVVLRAPLFPRPLCGRIFRNDSRSRHTPVYPTSKLAALSPPPRPPLIFQRPLRGRFFPRSKMLRAPLVSHHCTTPPSPCIWYGPVLQNTQLVIFFFKEEGLGERDACWLVGSKNAREKKYCP